MIFDDKKKIDYHQGEVKEIKKKIKRLRKELENARIELKDARYRKKLSKKSGKV